MGDSSQWPIIFPGFEMRPPKLERSAGRPRVERIKNSGEVGKRGPYQCKRCFQFGHIEKSCREPPVELGDNLPPPIPMNPRKRKEETSTSAQTPTKSMATQSPGPTTRSRVASTPSSGPTTRSRAAAAATPSPNPTSRRRTSQQSVSPGGIARRLIIN